MGAFVQLLEGSQPVITFEADVELYVRSALLSLLELPVHVGAMLEPLSEVLFDANVRIVECAEPVLGLRHKLK